MSYVRVKLSKKMMRQGSIALPVNYEFIRWSRSEERMSHLILLIPTQRVEQAQLLLRRTRSRSCGEPPQLGSTTLTTRRLCCGEDPQPKTTQPPNFPDNVLPVVAEE